MVIETNFHVFFSDVKIAIIFSFDKQYVLQPHYKCKLIL
jgi:hypothetical protein